MQDPAATPTNTVTKNAKTFFIKGFLAGGLEVIITEMLPPSPTLGLMPVGDNCTHEDRAEDYPPGLRSVR
jgi:hypothetical protein